jgi:hypothetical protein
MGDVKMAMRSWVLKSWPEVVWQPPASASLWPVFQHMGTGIREEPDEQGRTVGETVWAAQLDDGSVLGAAWEWVEAAPGVPALRDPNGFISNLTFVGDDGCEWDELQLIVGLNRIAYATAWQDTVRSVVGAVRNGAAPSLGSDVLDWSQALCLIDAAAGTGPVGAGRAHAAPANALMRPRALVA